VSVVLQGMEKGERNSHVKTIMHEYEL